MSNEHKDYKNRRLAALARYKEGLCLLENEKYFAAFYMFGFVLEIGIQANLYIIEEKVLKLKSNFFNEEYKNLDEFVKSCASLKENNNIKFLIRKEPIKLNKDNKSKGRHDLNALITLRKDALTYLENLEKNVLREDTNQIKFLESCLDIFKDWNPNNRYKYDSDSLYRENALAAKNKSRIFLTEILGYKDGEIPDFVPNEPNEMKAENMGEIKKYS